MSFATDLVAELERATAGHPVPRVRALHLPPAAAAASKNGEFCALELDDGALGISYVLLDDTLQRLIDAPDRGGIVGMDALALAREFAAPPPPAGTGRVATEARDLRRTRLKRAHDARLEAKAAAKLADLPGHSRLTDPAALDRKRAVIEAALARARARRTP